MGVFEVNLFEFTAGFLQDVFFFSKFHGKFASFPWIGFWFGMILFRCSVFFFLGGWSGDFLDVGFFFGLPKGMRFSQHGFHLKIW